jgi:hypothetical protein
MATIEEAVFERMSTYSAITTLIGTGSASRLYPLVIPQTAALPAVAYQKISSPKDLNHSGSSHLAHSRFQFTCAADDYSVVKTLTAAVRDCWLGFRGTVSGVRIDCCEVENDTDTALERQATASPVTRLDVLIWHEE